VLAGRSGCGRNGLGISGGERESRGREGGRGLQGITYTGRDVITPVLAPSLRLHSSLMHLEMPIHVRNLLLFALSIRLKPSTALSTLWSQILK
jgi:hypothetical protein